MAKCHSSTKAEIERKGYKKKGEAAVVIQPPSQAEDARVTFVARDRERAQPCDQLGPAGCVVTHRKEPPLRQHHHIQAVLRHVDTAEREHGHLRIPSLLMRARALATVRVWKKRPE